MKVLYFLTGFSSLILMVSNFLINKNFKLEQTQDLMRLLSGFLVIYLYLSTFLLFWIHNDRKIVGAGWQDPSIITSYGKVDRLRSFAIEQVNSRR